VKLLHGRQRQRPSCAAAPPGSQLLREAFRKERIFCMHFLHARAFSIVWSFGPRIRVGHIFFQLNEPEEEMMIGLVKLAQLQNGSCLTVVGVV